MAQESKSGRSSSAENLSTFFREIRQKKAAVATAEPPQLILDALRGGPRSMSELMNAVKLSFETLSETLDQLQKYGLVRSQPAADRTDFELTDDGRKAAG